MPRRHIAGGAVVAVIVAVVVVFWPKRHASEPPPVYGTVADFVMTDQAGAPFKSAEKLRGHTWAASFIFTRCPTICPLLTAKVKQVEEATRKNAGLRLVSFSVDPDFDQPPVLAEYARAHGADTTRWSFVTGDPTPVAAAMKIAFDKVPGKPPGESIVHGTHIVLVDKDMNIRGYYDSSDEDALKRLISDSAAL